MPKLIGSLVMAFAIGLIVPQVSGQLVQADVQDGKYYTSEYDEKGISCFEEALEIFHLEMNEEVNRSLDILVTEEFPIVDFVPAEECTTANVSTYCLAVRLNEELIALETYLTRRQEEGKLELNCEGGEESSLAEVKSLDEALALAALNNIFIENEMAAAEDVMDLTLEVYNQVQIVWPLHLELAMTISELETYRDNLAKLRNVVELYPGRFNDATTLQCK